eukprot:SAG31_NODE_1167_length_9572_cov_3.794046_9_plen_104_part_00
MVSVSTRCDRVFKCANIYTAQEGCRGLKDGDTKKDNTCTEMRGKSYLNYIGHLRESNPGPLAPKARIIPLDQGAVGVVGQADLQYMIILCNDIPGGGEGSSEI